MEDILAVKIECQNITKSYELHGSATQRLKSFFISGTKTKRFTALNNVNLTCYDGEIVGIVGVNGSGKSTLASIITGITFPERGEVTVNGKVSKLAASAGLDNEFTGRENITYKCLLMGMTKKKISEITNDIIAFADLGLFIDQPVKTYSSGMKARLGFGISVQSDPDILIIDEGLSVGDESFKQKAIDKIYEFKKQKKTIIFVSHNTSEIKRFCDKVLWLHKGHVVGFGDSKEIVHAYGKFVKEYSKMNSDIKESFIPLLSKYLPPPSILETRFVKVEPIFVGRSRDKKYIVTDDKGKRFFLKIEPIDNYTSVERFYALLKKVHTSGIPMPAPVEYGRAKEGAYILHEAVSESDYANIESLLPHLSEENRYSLGVKVGIALSNIHELPFFRRKDAAGRWNRKFPNWCADLATSHKESLKRFDGDEFYLDLLKKAKKLLGSRPTRFLHLDYGSHNIMLEGEELRIVDFGDASGNDGDAYYDFNHVLYNGEDYPHFYTGVIQGYFGGNIPEDFFNASKLYLAWHILKSLKKENNTNRVDKIIDTAKRCLKSYDNMTIDVPVWYLKTVEFNQKQECPQNANVILSQYNELLNDKRFKKFEEIKDGADSAKKYLVQDIDIQGKKYFAKVYKDKSYDTLKMYFHRLRSLFVANVPMAEPLDLIKYPDEICILYDFIEGRTSGSLTKNNPDDEIYAMGFQAGEALKKIHQMPLTSIEIETSKQKRSKYKKWALDRVEEYLKSSVRFDGDEHHINVLRNFDLNLDDTYSIVHYDYKPGGNIIIVDNEVKIIDFFISEPTGILISHPYSDFMRHIPKEISFNKGLVNGYFDNSPDEEFWHIFRFFCSYFRMKELCASIRAKNNSQIELDINILQQLTPLDLIPEWYSKP